MPGYAGLAASGSRAIRRAEVGAIGRQSLISRTRRQEIAQGARRIYAIAHAAGRSVDEIQAELLRTYPGELAAGEARMYAHGWTVRTVREGVQALASGDGLDCDSLQDADVWRYLRGEVYPREHLDRLCRLFRCHQAQLGWPARGSEAAVSFAPAVSCGLPAVMGVGALVPPDQLVDEPTAGGPRDWTVRFGAELAHLLALVEQWHGPASCEPLQLLVHQEVLMLDAARRASGDDEGFDPARRQLLVTLLALPVALSPSGLLGEASSALVRKLLAQCAASITAAWALLKQSDFAIVERHVSGYLLPLTSLARMPSPHQAEAARLASHAYRVLAIVALHRRQLDSKDYYTWQALAYAEIAADRQARWSALAALSDTALLYKHDAAGAAVFHQRLALDERAFTPTMRSRLHAKTALELAMRGDERPALERADLAQEAFPSGPDNDPMSQEGAFTRGNLVLYRGLTHLALGRHFPDRRHQDRAWAVFEGGDRLAVPTAVTERVRVEIVNQQAATAIEMRDLDRFAASLRGGVEGAQRLRSAQRLHEAQAAWERARQVWPSERRVIALEELFVDGPRQLGAGPQ